MYIKRRRASKFSIFINFQGQIIEIFCNLPEKRRLIKELEVNYNRNRDSVWIPRGSPRHSRNHSTIEPPSPSVMMTQLGNSLVPLEQLRVNPSTPSYAQLIKNSNSDENVERLT